MGNMLEVKQGEIVFCEGQSGASMYEIVSGKIGLYKKYDTEKQVEINKLEAGANFGEMAIIDEDKRSATAVALEDTKLNEISAEEFDTYIKENPKKFIDMMKNTSARLRRLSSDYYVACGAAKEFVANQESGKPNSKELMNKLKAIAEISNLK